MTAIATRPGDLELLDRVRRDDSSAFGELFSRYHGWALHLARTATRRYDPGDVVQEAFAKVLSSVRNGRGPRQGFAQYLRITVRSVAATWGARDARTTLVPLADDAACYEFEVTDLGECERPFRSLPGRWQRILSLTILHGLSLTEAAAVLGLTVAATSALAARARRGLREAVGPRSGLELAA